MLDKGGEEDEVSNDVKELIVKILSQSKDELKKYIIESKQEILNAVTNTKEKKNDSLKEDARDEINTGSLTYVKNVEIAVNLWLWLDMCQLMMWQEQIKRWVCLWETSFSKLEVVTDSLCL